MVLRDGIIENLWVGQYACLATFIVCLVAGSPRRNKRTSKDRQVLPKTARPIVVVESPSQHQPQLALEKERATNQRSPRSSRGLERKRLKNKYSFPFNVLLLE